MKNFEKKNPQEKISFVFHHYLQSTPKLKDKYDIRGYRFELESRPGVFQEVLFILKKGIVVCGMLVEEYPQEKKAYISYLESIYLGLGLAKVLVQEYSRFLSVFYNEIDLHIWADPPPTGKNYIFNGAGQPKPLPEELIDQTKETNSSEQPQNHSPPPTLLDKYMKDLAAESYPCEIFKIHLPNLNFPTFLSQADRKFDKIQDQINAIRIPLEELINMHLKNSLICKIRKTSNFSFFTPQFEKKPYLEQKFFEQTKLDFSNDPTAQEQLFEKLETIYGPTKQISHDYTDFVKLAEYLSAERKWNKQIRKR